MIQFRLTRWGIAPVLGTAIAFGTLLACSDDEPSSANSGASEATGGVTSGGDGATVAAAGSAAIETQASGGSNTNSALQSPGTGGAASDGTATGGAATGSELAATATGGSGAVKVPATGGTAATQSPATGGSAATQSPAAGGSSPSSGSPPATGGNTVSTGQGGASGALSSPTGMLTNLPSTATTSAKSTVNGSGLQLVSLNLVPDVDSTINYVELFGEIRNNGTALICFPSVTFEFGSASGTVLWSSKAFTDAAPYVTTLSSLSDACLKPGDSGAIWSNELMSLPMAVSSVAELRVTLDGLVGQNAKAFQHSLVTSVVPDSIYMDGSHWSMSGSFTPSVAVENVMVIGYTKSTSGLITGRLTATNLGTIAANKAWSFKSLVGIEGPRPGTILASVEFILVKASAGATAGAMSPLLSNPVLDPIALERQKMRRAAEERKALATAR